MSGTPTAPSTLDFVGGIAVNALGPRPPRRRRGRLDRQIASLGHVSNLFIAEPPVALAERLLQLFGRTGRVFFSNSGAEANEAAFKIGRLTGRTHMVATDGGFHGRTMGALALTGQPKKREPFLPLPGDVTHVPYGDVEALRAAVTTDTALVIIEPIQGENGVVVPPKGYLEAAREITRATGTLLVLDEVQTGIGRMRPVVRVPGPPGRRARHRHPRQGARRRAADRRHRRLRRGGRPAAARPARHDVRRQPGRLRRRSRRSRHARRRRRPRPGQAARREAPGRCRGPGAPTGLPRPRLRSAAGYRAHRAARAAGAAGGSGTPDSW